MATDERKDNVQPETPQISDLSSKKITKDEADNVRGGTLLKKTALESINLK